MPAERWRGTYSSRKEGRALLRRIGGVEAVTVARGMAEVSPTHARRGDLAQVLARGTVGLGIVALNGTGVVVVGDGGLMTLAIDRAVRAWMV